MGAQRFQHIICSENINNAFSALVERAKCDYGEDPYNGTISTCNLGRCVKKFNGDYDCKNEEYLATLEGGEKWEANYVDLGIVEYRVVDLKKTRHLSKSPVYKLFYVVWQVEGLHEKKTMLYKGNSQKQAEDWVKKHFSSPDIIIVKEPVYIEGEPIVTTYDVVIKSYTKKPSRISKEKHLIEIHKYCIFGWAAC